MPANILKKLDFTAQTVANPYLTLPAGWEYSVGSKQGRTFNLGAISWAANSVQSNIISSTPMEGVWIQSTVQLSTSQSNGSGACILDKATGNGYMITADTTSGHSIFKVAAGQLVTGALVQVLQATIPVVNRQKHTLRRNTVTNELQILIEGVLAASVIDATYAPMYGGCQSRYGYLRYVETEYTPAQEITSINGGAPFTASQTSGTASITGFSGVVTSITSNLTGLSFSGIGGTATDPTYTKSVPIDGAVYPKRGSTATLTFSKGAETANGTILINKDADQTAVIVASPINDDTTCLFGAIYAVTGRSAANGDEVYHAIPSAMLTNGVDTILPADAIAPDGTMQFYNAGSFPCWVWTAATGVNYYYWVTITESGGVIITSSSKNHYIGLGLGIGF